MLGLGQQVSSYEARIGLRIGNHEHLGGSGWHIDGDSACISSNLYLGFGHPDIAGAEQLVAAWHRFAAVSHRRDRLGTAELEHLADAAGARRKQHGLVAATIDARRRTHHHIATTGNLRRHAKHQCR